MAQGVANVIANIGKWEGLTKAGLTGLGLMAAKRAENYAKTHKKWENRTSHAVQGLFSNIGWEGSMFYVAVAHSVSYGVYLELAHGRKYQILEDAIGSQKDEFFEAAKKILQ